MLPHTRSLCVWYAKEMSSLNGMCIYRFHRRPNSIRSQAYANLFGGKDRMKRERENAMRKVENKNREK